MVVFFPPHHSSADPVEVNLAVFKSKYLHVCKCLLFSSFFYINAFILPLSPFFLLCYLLSAVPLYQDYCQRVVQDCSECSCDSRVVSEALVCEPITSQRRLPLQGLRFKAKLQVTVPQTSCFHRDALITFWQDLDEVKECGFLDTLGPREVNRQEVCRMTGFQVKSLCVWVLDVGVCVCVTI